MSTQTLERIFSEEEITQFTEGDCWILAEALWMRARGWTLIAVCPGEENPVEESTTIDFPLDVGWVHMAVQTPEGHIVDIEGVHTNLDAYLARWAGVAESAHGCCEPMMYVYEVFEYEEFEDLTRDQYPLYEFDGERVDEIVMELIAMTESVVLAS